MKKEITIKVLVSTDITACAQMRKKPKDSEWSDFICGIDLAGHVLIANSPQVWGRTFLTIAENIILAKLSRNSYYCEFDDLENIDYVEFLDDSQALVTGDADDYYERLDEVKAEQKKMLDKYIDNVTRGLQYNSEENCWEGYITIKH